MERLDLDHLEALERAAKEARAAFDAVGPYAPSHLWDPASDANQAAAHRWRAALREAGPALLARLRALEAVAKAAWDALDATNADSIDVDGDDAEVQRVMDTMTRLGAALAAAKETT